MEPALAAIQLEHAAVTAQVAARNRVLSKKPAAQTQHTVRPIQKFRLPEVLSSLPPKRSNPRYSAGATTILKEDAYS
eukprot:2620422-Alexandrium_andersonii.AAC.1